MLTRLKVNGFKNLIDVDVRFGSFTCIAGPNNVGKSNLLSAIKFLSLSSDYPFSEVVRMMNDDYHIPVSGLFHQVGNYVCGKMSFEVDMVLPFSSEFIDTYGYGDFELNHTFVRYSLELSFNQSEKWGLVSENLKTLPMDNEVHFDMSSQWASSVLKMNGEKVCLETDHNRNVVREFFNSKLVREVSLHHNIKKTLLSGATSLSDKLLLAVRCEMKSWQLFDFKPHLMRNDSLSRDTSLKSSGENLASVLHNLAIESGNAEHFYEQIAWTLKRFIDDVDDIITVDFEKKSVLKLAISGLSDTTLRVLGLATLFETSFTKNRLICLENPDNNLHPKQIKTLLKFLYSMASDMIYPVEKDNPLRQVIITTHSPAVVLGIDDGDLLMAEKEPQLDKDGNSFYTPLFYWLPDTWRCNAEPDIRTADKVHFLDYLQPIAPLEKEEKKKIRSEPPPFNARKRVYDRFRMLKKLLR